MELKPSKCVFELIIFVVTGQTIGSKGFEGSYRFSPAVVGDLRSLSSVTPREIRDLGLPSTFSAFSVCYH